VASLYTHGVRTALGLGRGAKAKIFPWFAAGVLFLVAAVTVAVRSQGGEMLLSYVEFPGQLSLLLILFCATTAPELVSRDLRSGVLPLYFSRPLTRGDYALGKLAAMVSAAWLLLVTPELLIYIGGVFTVKGTRAIWNETVHFGQGILVATLYALVFGSISLLIASLAGRRAVTAALIVVAFLVTTPVYGVLYAVGGPTVQALAGLVNPVSLIVITSSWLFGDDTGGAGHYGPLYAATTVATVVACVLLLLLRYRKVAR
jgi:ABC-2 type transport system permease protein